MEFNTKYNNDLASWATFSTKYFMKSQNRFKSVDGTGFYDEGSSSKGFSQDLHHFDQFPYVDEMLSNSKQGISTPFYDPFDPFTNGFSTNIDTIESKVFMEEEHARISDGTSCKAAKNIQIHKKSTKLERKWTKEDDRKLTSLVESSGKPKWSQMAKLLKGKNGKQCRERWENHLKPNIKKGFWTEEEDKILIQAHMEVGNKWTEIAKRLSDRTENSVKNHWNSTKRRQFLGQRSRPPKYAHASALLENYIKSLESKQSSSDNLKNTSTDTDTDMTVALTQLETTDVNEEPIANICLDTNISQETFNTKYLFDEDFSITSDIVEECLPSYMTSLNDFCL